MRTYGNVLKDLCTLLDDAVNMSEESESQKEHLLHINVDDLIKLSKDAEPYGDKVLTKKLTELAVFADESGNKRRLILSTPKPEFQKGTYNTTHRDIMSSFREKSALSFLFVNTNKKFIHCYFTIDNESNVIDGVMFNETIYNENDPAMIGGISILNDLERGLKTLTEYK